MSEDQKQTGGYVSVADQVKNIRDFFLSQKNEIAKVAEGGLPTVERLIKSFCMVMMRKDKEGKDSMIPYCTHISLLQCIMECARLGIDPALPGRAYLIPYGRSATLQLSYLAIVDMVKKSGDIEFVISDLVRPGDEFYVEQGLTPVFKHVLKFQGTDDSWTMVYALAKYKNSDHFEFTVVSREEIDRLRKRLTVKNHGKESPAWRDYSTEMSRKYAIRRLCKMLPINYSIEVAEALEKDGSEIIDAEFMPVPENGTSTVMSKIDSTVKKLLANKNPETPPPVPEVETPSGTEMSDEELPEFFK